MNNIFDDLCRVLAEPMPRKRALKLIAGGLAGAIMAPFAFGQQAPPKPNAGANNNCGPNNCGNSQTCCCATLTTSGTKVCSNPKTAGTTWCCPSGTKCANGSGSPKVY